MKEFSVKKEFARELDSNDELQKFRNHFYIPEHTIYMDGNSLGLLSKEAELSILRVLAEWKQLGIRGWLEAERPWFYFAEQVGAMAAKLVGAKDHEVILTGTTTVNIHALVSTFYKPHGKKTKILADELNFPSDLYALKGQMKLRSIDPDSNLLLVKADQNGLLDENDIVKLMNDTTALIFLPSVLYRSGQLLDMEYLTREAHKRDILIGFDCSHSVGAVPHSFSQWEVDFALWCSYKYLNGGPGGAAFLYVNHKHFDKEPLLAGWFGYLKEKQFEMLPDYIPAKDAGRWQISSPGILGSAPVEGSMKLINQAGIENMRRKSLKMTSYMIFLHKELGLQNFGIEIATPLEEKKRGGHIAFVHQTEASRIIEALKSKGVIPDLRPPNIIRIAPMAIYNTYEEVWLVMQYLKEIMENKEYENFDRSTKAVT
jgi:kynureninase